MEHLFCSDLDQNRAIFWSKSEIETPETPETRGTLWAHGLLMPEIFFESPGILLCQYVKELAGKDNVSGGERQDQNGMFRFWIHRFHGFRLLSRIMLIFGDCHNQPSRGSLLWLRCLQAALQASPSLAWSCPQYAVSDGGFGDCKRTVPLQSNHA